MEHVNNYKTIFKPFLRSFALGWKWNRKHLVIICILTIILGSSTYLQYASFSKIVDEIIRLKEFGGSLNNLVLNSIFLLLTFFIPAIIREFQQYLFVKMRFAYIRELTIMTTKEQAKLDIATVESEKFQDLMTKANSRGNTIIYQVLEQGIRNLENLSSIIVASIFILTITPVLFFVALFAAIPIFYFYKKYGTQIWWIWDLNPQNRRKYFDRFHMFTSVWHLTEMKLFQTKKKFQTEISDLLTSFDGEMEAAEGRRFKYQIFLALLEMLAMAFTIYVLVKAGFSGALAIGALLLAFNSYRGLFSNLKAFFLVLGFQDEFGKYASWWFDLFDLKPKIVSKKEALKPDWQKAPKVEFQNVSFKYEDSKKFALKNISLSIKTGEKTALVGLNGAGKTTFIKLIARVYDPTEGRILVDGIDLREIDLEHWHKTLGVLFQDFVDYRMTVTESIAIGKSGYISDMQSIRDATDQSTATEFIETYEKGFDQMLWKGFENGVEPSKGQRQKIAVSRIFYRNALISILDEPTSAIDAPSEEFIFNQLERLPENKSAILISHRMSVIKNADNIVVLQNGSIVEEGKHQELMQLKGEYSKLYRTQAKRMILEEEIEL